MADEATGAQAKTANLGIRVTPEEKALLEEYAEIRGETVADVIRQVGIDEAVQLALRVRARLSASA